MSLTIKALILLYIFLHSYSVFAHVRIMEFYKQICGHCDWWYDKGARQMLYVSFIPFLGPFFCVAAHADIVRNIILEMSKPDTHNSNHVKPSVGRDAK